MMKILQPDYEVLRRYVYEELSEEDQKALDLWLLLNTDESVINQILELHEQRRERELKLADCFKSNFRNKLRVLFYRCLNHSETKLGVFISEKAISRHEPAFQMLSQEKPRQQNLGESIVEISPKEQHEIRVKIHEASYYAAFIMDSHGKVVFVPGEKGREDYNEVIHKPETYNELVTVWMDVDDAPLEVWLIFDEEKPISLPPEDAKADWLYEVIKKGLDDNRKITISKYILKVMPLEPERTKER
ncbi:hypothetical protein QUF76_04310 [Desulfobacterales bacterium HSG16]|nr:hypothetical protein [Desulfobacterales bacterium HSG16]